MSISLTNLSKHIGNHLIVNNVSIDVKAGELFVLLGASGSGKSTILRLIAGLIYPESGQIYLHEKEVTYLPPQVRGVGFVFQNYSIFRHMTIAQNVEFGLRIRKVPQAKRRPRREELLDLVGLAGFADRYPNQLSGGQQQRVALARALAYQPQVLLLDEPFGALDVQIRAQLRENLKNIQRQLNITTVLVTHDQEEAFELADRIGVVDNGHLLEVGTPSQLYHYPSTEFVATFIGGGNVLVGRKEDGQIRLGQVKLPFPENAPEHEDETPVRTLFRPASVRLQPEPFSPQSPVYPLGQGKIVRQVFTGSTQRIRVEMEGLQGVRPITPSLQYGQRSVQIEALLPAGPENAPALQVGQTVWAAISHYHVLQPAGLKILICVDQIDKAQMGAAFGLRLAAAVSGQATLLTVTPETAQIPSLQEWLDNLLSAGNLPPGSRLRTRIRQGAYANEILAEAQEGFYEVVVFGGTSAISTEAMGTNPMTTARQILTYAEVPVLLVQSLPTGIQHILVCTAGGEPGKTDVRFGGRLARRIGASVTLFHVLPAAAEPAVKTRAEKHLADGQLLLAAMGVRCQTRMVYEDAIKSIIDEAEQGNYDLIVIGAPAPRTNLELVWSDVTTQIVKGTRRPVLMVPMKA